MTQEEYDAFKKGTEANMARFRGIKEGFVYIPPLATMDPVEWDPTRRSWLVPQKPDLVNRPGMPPWHTGGVNPLRRKEGKPCTY